MSEIELSAILGVITSLLFSYFPVLRDKFDALEGDVKRLIQVGAGALVAVAIFGLSCAAVLDAFTCDWNGARLMLVLLLDFLIANQTVYALTPRKK